MNGRVPGASATVESPPRPASAPPPGQDEVFQADNIFAYPPQDFADIRCDEQYDEFYSSYAGKNPNLPLPLQGEPKLMEFTQRKISKMGDDGTAVGGDFLSPRMHTLTQSVLKQLETPSLDPSLDPAEYRPMDNSQLPPSVCLVDGAVTGITGGGMLMGAYMRGLHPYQLAPQPQAARVNLGFDPRLMDVDDGPPSILSAMGQAARMQQPNGGGGYLLVDGTRHLHHHHLNNDDKAAAAVSAATIWGGSSGESINNFPPRKKSPPRRRDRAQGTVAGGAAGGMCGIPAAIGVACSNAPNMPGFSIEELVGGGNVKGYLFIIAKDQAGCRSLQKKLQEEPALFPSVFQELMDSVVSLMTDPFGNYLCQRVMEMSSQEDLGTILGRVGPEVVNISLNMHGTRAVQRLIEMIRSPEQIEQVVSYLQDSVVVLVKDLNGNHVIQKSLQTLTAADNQYVYDAIRGHCFEIATHRHGCCVLQRCIDAAVGTQRDLVVEEIIYHAVDLVQDAYGNYVIQYVLAKKEQNWNNKIIAKLLGSLVRLSKQKFASNVVEKCMMLSSNENKHMMVEELLSAGSEALRELLLDSFANYVIQRALNVADEDQFNRLIEGIRPHMETLKSSTSGGKRIALKLSKKYPKQLGVLGGGVIIREGGNPTAPSSESFVVPEQQQPFRPTRECRGGFSRGAAIGGMNPHPHGKGAPPVAGYCGPPHRGIINASSGAAFDYPARGGLENSEHHPRHPHVVHNGSVLPPGVGGYSSVQVYPGRGGPEPSYFPMDAGNVVYHPSQPHQGYSTGRVAASNGY